MSKSEPDICPRCGATETCADKRCALYWDIIRPRLDKSAPPERLRRELEEK